MVGILTFIRRLVRSVKRNIAASPYLLLSMSKIYIALELSVNVLLMENLEKKTKGVDMEKFFKVVQNNGYCDSAMELPHYSLRTLWPSKFLDKERDFETGSFTLREALSDRQILHDNIDRISELVLTGLPFLFKLKLGIESESKRTHIRNELALYIEKKFIADKHIQYA